MCNLYVVTCIPTMSVGVFWNSTIIDKWNILPTFRDYYLLWQFVAVKAVCRMFGKNFFVLPARLVTMQELVALHNCKWMAVFERSRPITQQLYYVCLLLTNVNIWIAPLNCFGWSIALLWSIRAWSERSKHDVTNVYQSDVGLANGYSQLWTIWTCWPQYSNSPRMW